MPLRSSNRLRDIGLCGGAYKQQLVGPFWTPILGPFSTPIDTLCGLYAPYCRLVRAGAYWLRNSEPGSAKVNRSHQLPNPYRHASGVPLTPYREASAMPPHVSLTGA